MIQVLSQQGRRDVSILGWDIRAAVGLLRMLHQIALDDLTGEMAELDAGRPPPPPTITSMSEEEINDWLGRSVESFTPAHAQRFLERAARFDSGTHPLQHLLIAYKKCLIFIRAYQDALARVLRYALEGVDARRATMTAKLGKEPPTAVGRLVAERVPGYETWFWGWRNLRNRVKDGVLASGVAHGADYGLRFPDIPSSEGSVDLYQRISLSEISEALHQSAALAKIAADLLGEPGTPT